MPRKYGIASQRCGSCLKPFPVLEDEVGDHDCPYCGASPDDPQPKEEDEEE